MLRTAVLRAAQAIDTCPLCNRRLFSMNPTVCCFRRVIAGDVAMPTLRVSQRSVGPATLDQIRMGTQPSAAKGGETVMVETTGPAWPKLTAGTHVPSDTHSHAAHIVRRCAHRISRPDDGERAQLLGDGQNLRVGRLQGDGA